MVEADKFIWRPDDQQIASSNLMAFIRRCGLEDFDELIDQARKSPEWFWDSVLRFGDVRFAQPYEKVRDISAGPEWTKWCVGGRTNLVLNTLDKHRGTPTEEKVAIIWESESGITRKWTYGELDRESCRFAAGLEKLGIRRGDVVGVYLPTVPETLAVFYGIARIGAIAMPMFSGFAQDAIASRLIEAEAVAVITANGTMRRGRVINMKAEIDKAIQRAPSVRHVVVVETLPGETIDLADVRDVLWSNLKTGLPDRVPTAAMASEDPLMLVFTSGTTGSPKGMILTHCGVPAKMVTDFHLCMDVRPTDKFMWFTDFGWAVGPFVAVACHMCGATIVIAEGTPDYPEVGRMWRLVQDHGVSILGSAPTAVRTLMRDAPDAVGRYDISSLRVTVSGGEPWTEEAWLWFFDNVSQRRLPMLNWSGGTEIGGGILCGTVIHPAKPCAFTCQIPGMDADIVDEEGDSLPPGEQGELVLRSPSMGLTRGMWKDDSRYLESYWSRYPGMWRQGDLAVRDKDGMWWIRGRSDDTLKIAGKRAGPSEIEALLMSTGKIAAAAVVGIPDKVAGMAVACVCVPASSPEDNDKLAEELKDVVAGGLGKPFRPKRIIFVEDLVKNQSGKIMRRVIRDVILGEPHGDLSTLINPDAISCLQRAMRG